GAAVASFFFPGRSLPRHFPPHNTGSWAADEGKDGSWLPAEDGAKRHGRSSQGAATPRWDAGNGRRRFRGKRVRYFRKAVRSPAASSTRSSSKVGRSESRVHCREARIGCTTWPLTSTEAPRIPLIVTIAVVCEQSHLTRQTEVIPDLATTIG